LRIIQKFLSMFKIRIFFSKKIDLVKQHSEISYNVGIAKDLVKIKKAVNQDLGSSFKQSERIVWVVPPATHAAGGFRTISRFIKFLDASGITQEIQIYHPLDLADEKQQASIWNNYFGVSRHVKVKRVNPKSYPNAVVIATGWQTMAHVICNTERHQRILFVQDDETLFHPHGDLNIVVDSLYASFPSGITAGPWLADLVKKRGVNKVVSFGFGVDRMFFSPKNSHSARRNQIVVYVQPKKSWRATTILLASIFELSESKKDWRFILVGEDSLLNIKTPSNVRCMGAISPILMARLYSESQIGIVASFSNASLVPLEMVASGMKVLTNTGDNSDWISQDCDHIDFVEFSQTNIVNSVMKFTSPESAITCRKIHDFDWNQEISTVFDFFGEQLFRS
jgi:hypothetical protein